MTRRDWLRLSAGNAATPLWADDSVPGHPRDLEFPKLDFEPPSPEGLRHELDGGAVAYLVEDHQLPLVNVSLTVRMGSYLVSAENWGLASATEQEEGGLPRRGKP